MAIDCSIEPDMRSLSVGQLAARAGVRADTIRYYERAGLLPEPDRTDGDHRRYGPADLDRMLFIRGARRLGLRLAEIRELVMVRDTGICPCGPAETLLREHVVEIDREIARLTALRAELSGMITGLSGTSGSCPDPIPGTWRAADRQDTEPDTKEVTGMCSCCDDPTCEGCGCDCGC
jgi:DNA-binding transcriptional MerR regulator